MFPGRVALDWLFDRISLDPKSKSNASTLENQFADFLTTEISNVMSGIISGACSISSISVLQCAVKQWRTEYNKIHEKNESHRNRDQ